MTDLKCSTCGKPMPQTAVPAEKAWCSDECYAAADAYESILRELPTKPDR